MSVMMLNEGEWTEIGHTMTPMVPDPFGSDLPVGESPLDASWSYDFAEALKSLARTFYFTVNIPRIDPLVLRLLYGAPTHPVKGWPHTGKGYRRACRQYQRALKAWRKDTGLR